MLYKKNTMKYLQYALNVASFGGPHEYMRLMLEVMYSVCEPQREIMGSPNLS